MPKIPVALIQIGLIVGVIAGLIVGSIVWAQSNRGDRQVITQIQLFQFCSDHGVPLSKCKVKKAYVVVPKGSR